MRKTITLALIGAASALALSATSASAQSRWYDHGQWMSINERQAQLEHRIDAGVRRGDLTHREARRLQGEFNHIAQLESRYRRDGLSPGERADLDRRFDRLAARIHWQATDNQYGGGYGHQPDWRR